MNRIISVANQKGGVGKTTTAVNLSSCLAHLGKKVLLIDSDPQGNSTSGLGINKNDEAFTLYNLILKECYINEATIKTQIEGLSLIPSNVDLAGAEIELINVEDREYILKSYLDNTKFLYDFIIIDCPPSLNILTVNALTASDTVLVPIQCEYYALEGLSQLLYTVNIIKERLNNNLDLEGIVFTMFDARTNLSMEIVDEVKKHLIHHNIFKTIIPRNIRLSEAPSHGKPINLYDKNSKGAISYMQLAKEVIQRSDEL